MSSTPRPRERKRLLVTGAAGFIGTNFLNRVKHRHDFEVIGVFNGRKPTVNASNIRYLEADLTNWEECRRLVADVHYVCMFAGRLSTLAILRESPLGPVAENTVMNVQMLDAAAASRVEKFLWLSSTTGYPSGDHAMTEDDFFTAKPPAPYEPVGWMSRYVEKLGMLYSSRARPPMTVISIRPTAVFGEHDDFDYETCHALPALMRRVIERQSPIEIWGTGEEARDWLYVDDLVDACLLALDHIARGYEALNIGTGRQYTNRELVKDMLEIDGYRDADIVYRPAAVGSTATRSVDCSRAKRILGFRAKTPMITGLTRTMSWYREYRSGTAG